MPIYTLTIQIRADIQADSEEEAQQAAIDHFVEQFEESEILRVNKVMVEDVQSDRLLSMIMAFTMKGEPVTAEELDMEDLPHLQALVDGGSVVTREDEWGNVFYETRM